MTLGLGIPSKFENFLRGSVQNFEKSGGFACRCHEIFVFPYFLYSPNTNISKYLYSPNTNISKYLYCPRIFVFPNTNISKYLYCPLPIQIFRNICIGEYKYFEIYVFPLITRKSQSPSVSAKCKNSIFIYSINILKKLPNIAWLSLGGTSAGIVLYFGGIFVLSKVLMWGI